MREYANKALYSLQSIQSRKEACRSDYMLHVRRCFTAPAFCSLASRQCRLQARSKQTRTWRRASLTLASRSCCRLPRWCTRERCDPAACSCCKLPAWNQGGRTGRKRTKQIAKPRRTTTFEEQLRHSSRCQDNAMDEVAAKRQAVLRNSESQPHLSSHAQRQCLAPTAAAHSPTGQTLCVLPVDPTPALHSTTTHAHGCQCLRAAMN